MQRLHLLLATMHIHTQWLSHAPDACMLESAAWQQRVCTTRRRSSRCPGVATQCRQQAALSPHNAQHRQFGASPAETPRTLPAKHVHGSDVAAGTGKTLLARAAAAECGASFLALAPSSVASKWLGDGVRSVRAAFSLAAKLAPCVLFVDEVRAAPAVLVQALSLPPVPAAALHACQWLLARQSAHSRSMSLTPVHR